MIGSQYGGGSTGGVPARTVAPLSVPSVASHNAFAAAALQAAQWAAASYAVQPQSNVPTTTSPAAFGETSDAVVPAVAANRSVGRAKSSWPLNFETNGASYVFQTQSGVFYDASQRYYYCPKSKLYYNEVSGVYLCVAPAGSDHPYQEFEPPEPPHKPTDEIAPTSTQQVTANTHAFYANNGL